MKTTLHQVYRIKYEILIQQYVQSNYKEHRIGRIDIASITQEAALAKFDEIQNDVVLHAWPDLKQVRQFDGYDEPFYIFKVIKRCIF